MTKLLNLSALFGARGSKSEKTEESKKVVAKSKNAIRKERGKKDAKEQKYHGFHIGGFRHFNSQAIFIPDRKPKLKGYMRDKNWRKRRNKAA